MAVDTFLKVRLGQALPDAAWLSEETADDLNRLVAVANYVAGAIPPEALDLLDEPVDLVVLLPRVGRDLRNRKTLRRHRRRSVVPTGF